MRMFRSFPGMGKGGEGERTCRFCTILRSSAVASHMPKLEVLRRVLPYYRPYRLQLAAGLVLVVVSSALVSVVPRLLQIALDRIRAGVPTRNIWAIGGAMVAVTIIAGAMRFGMRMYLNSVSRWMEYDLRNDLFTKLETL